jgi:filamentous hemagglutinin family protein
MADAFRRLGPTLVATLLAAGPAPAQIVTDGTVGPKVSLRGGQMEIGANLGTRRGDNLFHSFDKFGIATGQTATFRGPDSIKNVISRVTGGEVSQIDGTLASKVGQADLYFLNPAGVVFGPNAQLDVPGSLHVSTAHELRFADGARFAADGQAGNSLTVAPPEAFGFLDRPAGPIAVDNSQLFLETGKTLSLVGGNLDITGGPLGVVAVESGTINLISVATGQVRVADAAVEAARGGAVRVSDFGLVDTSGDGGGTVRIRGGRIDVTDSTIGTANTGARTSAGSVDIIGDTLRIARSNITNVAFAAGNAGSVSVRARESLELDNGAIIGSGTAGDGHAGPVLVEAGRLEIAGSDLLTGIASSTVEGTGNAGPVTIRGREITLSDSGFISNTTTSRGKAGTLAIEAGTIRLRSGGLIFGGSTGGGDAGSVTVRAGRLELAGNGGATETAIITETVEQGAAGRLTVLGGEIELSDGAVIESSTKGDRDAGAVRVEADRIDLFGNGRTFTGIQSEADPGAAGAAGPVTVTTRGDLGIFNGAEIRSLTYNDRNAGSVAVRADRVRVAGGEFQGFTGLSSSAIAGSGNAGSVAITAHRIDLLHYGQIGTSTFAQGDAGTITIHADEALIADNSAILSNVETDASGKGGQVFVAAHDLQLINGGQIASATFGSGAAGHVTIEAGFLLVSGVGTRASAIASSAEAGSSGKAGSVSVTAQNLEVRARGKIFSDTSGTADAGTVQVHADRLLVSGDGAQNTDISSDTNPESLGGAAGNVQIAAHDLQVRKGGQISSRTFSSGAAGRVDVRADRLVVSGDGATWPTAITSAAMATSSGAGGAVTIQAHSIVLQDQGAVTTASDGTGPGGPISISAADTVQLDHAAIRAQTASARGGDVTVAVGWLFDLHNSTVTTSVAGGTGSGGNIFVHAPPNSSGGIGSTRFLVLDDSRIEANAKQGSGGNITIQAGQLLRTPDSVIQASSELGLSGTITIAAPNTDVAGSLVILPETFLDASSQLPEACAARGGQPTSSLTLGGRGGLPPDPGAPLAASPLGQPSEPQGAVRLPVARSAPTADAVTANGGTRLVFGAARRACRG